jgi:hypothetical protein
MSIVVVSVDERVQRAKQHALCVTTCYVHCYTHNTYNVKSAYRRSDHGMILNRRRTPDLDIASMIGCRWKRWNGCDVILCVCAKPEMSDRW